MSLATRCTACGTVFRVVQDQLRVSSGWVRCGRCGEVFNAIESLVDLEVERPEAGPPSVHGGRVMEELARVSGFGAPEAPSPSAPASPAASAAPLVMSDPPAAEPVTTSDFAPLDDTAGIVVDHEGNDEDDLAPAAVPAATPATAGDPATAEPPMARDDEPLVDADDASPAPLRLSAQPEVDGKVDADGGPVDIRTGERATLPAPSFVRQADRAARWRHPAVRALLLLVLIAAGAGLAWQANLSHHDWIAARWPALKPAVEAMCGYSGCRVAPPRHLDALVVESSGLVKAGGDGSYRLSVSVRNRGDILARTPSLDLTLSDAGGGVVARRVLSFADLGEPATGLAPGTELSASRVLRIAGAPVAGYTIEIFYP